MEIPQILVISLTHSLERRQKVDKTLNQTNFNWSYLDAIDGTKLDDTQFNRNPSKVSRLLGFSLTPTEIGCFLSHRKAWEQCVHSGKNTLIFEDDFILNSNLQEALEILITQYIDWDIARLQALKASKHQLVKAYGSHQVVINHEDPLGATAYLLKPKAARELLSHSQEIFEPLDHFLEHRKKHGLRIVAFKPYPVSAGNMPTTITGRPNREPITGPKKLLRSLLRWHDRKKNPHSSWFPK